MNISKRIMNFLNFHQNRKRGGDKLPEGILNRKFERDVEENEFKKFVERFTSAFNRIQEFVPNYVLNGRSCDIGCGSGNGVAASLALGANFAVGVDIKINSSTFNDFLKYLNLCPERAFMIEIDIMNARFIQCTFDYITMIDVAEHIPKPLNFFNWAFDSLKNNGILFVDTLPLYYSIVGHHLWPYFTEEIFPWAHLRKDFKKICQESLPKDFNYDFYRTYLNKYTHQELRECFINSGFEIIFEHRDHHHIHPGRYEKFMSCKHELDIDGIDERLLFEARLILVGKKRACQ
jgi:SAM-dependent methyltransferase